MLLKYGSAHSSSFLIDLGHYRSGKLSRCQYCSSTWIQRLVNRHFLLWRLIQFLGSIILCWIVIINLRNNSNLLYVSFGLRFTYPNPFLFIIVSLMHDLHHSCFILSFQKRLLKLSRFLWGLGILYSSRTLKLFIIHRRLVEIRVRRIFIIHFII